MFVFSISTSLFFNSSERATKAEMLYKEIIFPIPAPMHCRAKILSTFKLKAIAISFCKLKKVKLETVADPKIKAPSNPIKGVIKNISSLFKLFKFSIMTFEALG